MVVKLMHWVTVGLVMQFKTIASGAALSAVMFATSATAAVYECNIRANGLFGAIAPVLIFSMSDNEDVVFVYDGMIKEFHDKPLKATIAVANTKRYTFKWSVDVISTSDGESMPRIDYRATYLKRNGRITITGFPAGWDNQYNGTGTCKRTE